MVQQRALCLLPGRDIEAVALWKESCGIPASFTCDLTIQLTSLLLTRNFEEVAWRRLNDVTGIFLVLSSNSGSCVTGASTSHVVGCPAVSKWTRNPKNELVRCESAIHVQQLGEANNELDVKFTQASRLSQGFLS